MPILRDLGRCVVVVGMLAGLFGGIRLASASCTGPLLRVEPRAVKPGKALTITGKAFSNAPCNDQGETGGCFGSRKPEVEPIRGIELSVFQGGRAVPLATVDADINYHFEITVPLPSTLHPGSAVVNNIPIEVLPAENP